MLKILNLKLDNNIIILSKRALKITGWVVVKRILDGRRDVYFSKDFQI